MCDACNGWELVYGFLRLRGRRGTDYMYYQAHTASRPGCVNERACSSACGGGIDRDRYQLLTRTTVWGKYGTYVVTFRAGARAARLLPGSMHVITYMHGDDTPRTEGDGDGHSCRYRRRLHRRNGPSVTWLTNFEKTVRSV